MASKPQVYALKNFSGGIDRREGVFADQQNRFKDLVNYRVSNVKRIVRRPPLILNAGAFANCQGLIEKQGALFTIAKSGNVATMPTGSGVTAVYFDNPDYCTTWSLIDAIVFNGSIVALIRHTFPGTIVTNRIMLHVFDGKANKPTYVEDPACPTNWAPSFPLNLYGPGTAGSFDATYVPRLQVAGGRLYLSRPDGNTAFSKTANARVWNTRTVDDILTGGEWYYFIIPAGTGTRDFIVSEAFATLKANELTNWTAWLAEYFDTTAKQWMKMEEILAALPGSDKKYYFASVPSRFVGGPNEIQLKVNWTGSADVVIRFRLIAGRGPTAIGPTMLHPSIKAVQYFNGTGAMATFTATTMKHEELSRVYVGGVLKTAGVDYTVVSLFGGLASISINAAVGVNNVAFEPGSIVYNGTMSFEGRAVTQYGGDLLTSKSVSLYAGTMVPYYVLFNKGTETNFSVAVETGLTPYDGSTRYYAVMVSTLTATAGTPVVPGAYAVYHYGWEPGYESAFFIARKTIYQTDLSGAQDAGFLPSAAQPGSGGHVTALAAIKDRLLIFSAEGSQLWAVSGDVTSHALIDSGPIGTGTQAQPAPEKVQGSVIVCAARGLRAVALSGSNLDALRDQNLGEPITDLGTVTMHAAAYWPWYGEYFAACTIGGVFQYLVLDHSPESKITAWSRWVAVGVTAPDLRSMVAVGNRMYVRNANALYYFDAGATAFRDTNDPAGAGSAYESKATWHFNDFQRPGVAKLVMGADLVQTGACTLAFKEVVHDEAIETAAIPLEASTYSHGRVPVNAWGAGIAPIIRSTDETGHEIQELSLTFAYQAR